MIYCYFILLSAQCYKIQSLELYKIIETFKGIQQLCQEVDTRGYKKLSFKVQQEILRSEVDQNMIEGLEEVFYSSKKKTSESGTASSVELQMQ